MKRKIALAAALLAVAGAAGRQALSQSPDDPLDPLRVAPDTHKLAFENAFVRVLEVRVPPGKTEPRHRHSHGVTVYFNDWDAKITLEGGKSELHHRAAGTFAWSDAIVHTVENTGRSEGHVLRIELKL
jgi:hypothetical protein